MKTIEFESAQNVKIEYEFASAGQRIASAFVAIAIYVALMYYIIGRVARDNFMLLELILIKIPFIFYHPISEYLTLGQTLGKYALGIRVTTYDGERPGLREIFTRWMFKGHFIWIGFSFMGIYTWGAISTVGAFVFFASLHVCIGGIGLLYASVTEKKQRMGDIMAGTLMIKNKSTVRYTLKDVLSIKNQENYTPEFPEAIRFTDEDMLLIKNTIQRVRSNPNPATKKFAIELADESARLLGLDETPKKRLQFLKTLLQDYVVLTR